MDIEITLKEKSKPLYGPEVSNNLPGGVMVAYVVKLAEAIRRQVVDSTRAREIKSGLSAADWRFAGGIDDSMPAEPPRNVIGTHRLKFRIGKDTLAKTVRCIIQPPKEQGPDSAGKANAAAVRRARKELDEMKRKFPDAVSTKDGDKKHGRNVIYSLTMGEEKLTASLPDPLDTHIKEGSLKAALSDWKKNRSRFIAWMRQQGKKG